MQEIIIDSLPAPAGHYSHAVVSGTTIYSSGILPVGVKPDANIDEQFKQVFDVIEKILATCGSTFDDVVRCHIYLADINDWDMVNKLYAARFGEHRPARSLIPVPELHFGYRLEAEVIAEINPQNLNE